MLGKNEIKYCLPHKRLPGPVPDTCTLDVKNVTYRVKSAFTKKHFLTTWPLGGPKKIVPC